jgi:C-terminal processing protease CtpA/Prc
MYDRRHRFLALVVAFLPAAALAQSPVRLDAAAPKPVNLDFEASEAGAVPPGWTATTAPDGYAATASAEGPLSGKLCAVMRAESPTGQFGVLMQAVDATPFRGHRVRLRGALRATDARAMLWLRVDRAGKRTGFFDNMSNRPVTEPEWKRVEIVGDVDDDAESINFGLLMLGTGATGIDDVAIEDLGKVTVVREPARALAGRGLANVEAFARLLGYVRFFHPSDEAASADWETLAVEGVRRVEGAASPEALARELEAIFHPVAPTLSVTVAGAASSRPKELDPAESPVRKGPVSVVQWRHQGCGVIAQNHEAYASERQRAPLVDGAVPAGFHDPRTPFVATLPGGVSCALPLALFADEGGTLPHAAPKPAAEPALVRLTGDDRATRLADVALAWGVLQHFYPYFDVAQTDWAAELERALVAAATDAGAEPFTRTLRRMVAALHDGHGYVSGPGPCRGAALPVTWGWIEGQLVVTSVAQEGAGGLGPGDVVETIDGRPSLAVLEELERLISAATPQWARYSSLEELRFGPEGSTVALAVRNRDGARKTVTLTRTGASGRLAEARPGKIVEVEPDVFYVDLGEVSDTDVAAALPRLAKAKGVVLDMRGYPSNLSPELLQHLSAEPMQSARWNVPIVKDPDWNPAPEWATEGRWDLKPLEPRLTGKVAFLTDGRAISYAESWMGIVEAYGLGAIVGETTAGTNGNVNPIRLPGGYTVSWTGMKVLKHDGSRHHGVGIAPTVPVSRTIQGEAEGRDEQLERAVAVVSAKP